MVLKPLKIRPPCHVLLDYFTTRPSFKNLYNPPFKNIGDIFLCGEMCKRGLILEHKYLLTLNILALCIAGILKNLMKTQGHDWRSHAQRKERRYVSASYNANISFICSHERNAKDK